MDRDYFMDKLTLRIVTSEGVKEYFTTGDHDGFRVYENHNGRVKVDSCHALPSMMMERLREIQRQYSHRGVLS